MAYERHAILDQYPKDITEILKATTTDPKDETARMKVATTLARALSFTKRRTGEDRVPADTEVFKLASVIRKAKNQEQFGKLLEEALPKAKVDILQKYNLAWKLSWTPAEEVKGRKRRRGRAEATEVPDADTRIGVLEEAMSRIEKDLSDLRAMIASSDVEKVVGQVNEILRKLKAHQHDREDGRAYILEKKEL